MSLVDLLDTYMKDCVTDKSIRPFGGALHVNYDEAWNPPGMLCVSTFWQCIHLVISLKLTNTSQST